MRNCIKADILRVQRKKSLLIMICVSLSIAIIGALVIKLLKLDASLYEQVISVLSGFNGLMIGIPVFSAVLSDDFKSKSMQTAIGHGLTRNKVILARFFEIVITIVEAYVILSLAMFIIGKVVGTDSDLIFRALGKSWIEVIALLCHISIAIIFVYCMQNGTLGLVLFILMASGFFSGMLMLTSAIPFLAKRNISIPDYVPSGMIDNFINTANSMPKRTGSLIAAILFYIVLPLFITMKIFKNKELDF